MKFENTVDIHQGLETVFEYVANFENIPNWNYAIENTTKATEGPVSVGTEYVQRRTLPRPMHEKLVVTEFVVNSLVKVEGGFGQFSGSSEYIFTPLDNASTRLVNRIDLEGKGLLKLASPLIGSNIKQAVSENLQVLKNILEG